MARTMATTVSRLRKVVKLSKSSHHLRIDLKPKMAILKVALDAIVLYLKLTYLLLEAFVKLFIPCKEKDVSAEIVLITGGAQGIGREIAFGYGRLGATVITIDVNSSINAATLNDLRKEGFKAYGYTCDITNRDEVLSLAEAIEREIGKVTILVNNAGVLTTQPIEKHTEKQVRMTFEVNIIAHFWLIQAFLPSMVEMDKGHIVATSSAAGLVGSDNATAYCATKWAIRGLMESLRKELEEKKSKVKLTTVCPFFVQTGFCKKPRVGLFRLLSPRTVAKWLIKAQRRNAELVSIPRHLAPLVNLGNILPLTCKKACMKFLGFGIDACD